MDKEELRILGNLDTIITRESVRATIDSIVWRAEQKLTQNPEALLAWEPVPLAIYGQGLPDMIRSGWVFVLRAQTNTGAERHPNSHQRMMSSRGSGNLQIWDGKKWNSNRLISDTGAPLERRWLSIPANVWHQAVVTEENWAVMSFHTVPENELIEERPDATDVKLTRQRRYVEA
ncbi:MAG: hypothetical protein JSV77_10415 [Dehalococcoidales bacterium]|nr:MAG: hypothetical protein JSV77_10415 [Dehalococcoidales bacterium]